MIIGSHVSMAAKDYLVGSVNEMLSYHANAMMIYTGAPQNRKRVPLNQLRIDEYKQLMAEYNLPLDRVIVHAPYLINLANTVKPETFALSVELLINEIKRTQAMGAKYLVLHPGSHVGAGEEIGLQSIVKGLDLALKEAQDVIVCIETMAGKGSECGNTFESVQQIIENCHYQENLGVCLDTCHVHDAGYDVRDFDRLLNEFDAVIGLEKLHVIHLNDSQNIKGAHKDRHANIGHGHIGFDALCQIAHHPLTAHIAKILETPYVNGQAPYGIEIQMLKQQKFDENALQILQ